MTPDIQLRDSAAPFEGAGGDELFLRLATEGDDPVTVVEGVSSDPDFVPPHSHPWDELTYVLEGVMEFRAGSKATSGGPGTLVSLPREIPHTLRVPEGEARYLMITMGAPSVDFLKQIGRAYAEGPTLERLVEIAERHGVKLERQPSKELDQT